MALRMMRLASGDARSQDELNRMVVEKMTALAEAQMAAATAIMNGHKDHVVAHKALSVFRSTCAITSAACRSRKRMAKWRVAK